jgi:hypothetical protein
MPRRSSPFRAVFTALLLTFSVACGETVIPKLEGDALNPDTHRAPIVTLDAILFEDGPLGATDREEVAKQLVVVADAASQDPSNTIAMVHSRELRQLADIAKRTKTGTPRVNSQLRMQWFRIRSSLFGDAWWFRRSSRDPIAKPEPDAPSASTSSALTSAPLTADRRNGLEHVLVSLGGLIEKAKRDLPNSYDSEPHRQFVADLQREMVLNDVRLGPPPGTGGDAAYKDAYESADEAISALKRLGELGPGIPAGSRELLIKMAQEHLAKAIKSLSGSR